LPEKNPQQSSGHVIYVVGKKAEREKASSANPPIPGKRSKEKKGGEPFIGKLQKQGGLP